MRASELFDKMNHPESLDLDSLAKLSRLVEDYPYFQTARILYLINLQIVKDSAFGSALKETACYSVDRRKLFLQTHWEEFSPLMINRLEKIEDSDDLESPFSLVELYLSDKEAKVSPEIPPKRISDTNRMKVSTDYVSILLAETDDENKKSNPVVPFQNQDVIDRFLEEDLKAPVRIKMDSSKDTDEILAIEDELIPGENDFFSETLAKIYLKQKKYDKALEIIRKLNLLNPEKSIYFADQIRFLEKLITNIKK